MAIIQERQNANKPPPPAVDPKKQINNNKDLDVDPKKEEPSFFGSFFSGPKGGSKKKTGPVMEAVSEFP